MILVAKVYLVAVGVTSLIAFGLFGIDKRRARRDSRARIPENTLHLISLLGGWPGALLGQSLFRHKTLKLSFRVRLWVIIAMHLVLIIAWAYLYLR